MATEILIVDDDPLIRETLRQQLSALGYGSRAVPDGSSADQALPGSDFGAVLLDLALPDTTGTALLERWQQASLQTPIIMISGTATVPDAVRALKLGAADFLVKPIDLHVLEATIRRVLSAQALKIENVRLRQLTSPDRVEFVGESPLVKDLLSKAERVAGTDQTVLLEGETGTGKQVLAKWIHAHSPRAGEPFVTVNCAAITETLFESELFGHEKGAFTGAGIRKPGKLELVGNGTLFLDEIGELPVHCQAKLLTAVEDRVFERVGGVKQLAFTGRIIAATNRTLSEEIAKGTFRKDLYYRLSAFSLRLPALREHSEDVPLYTSQTLNRCRRSYGRSFEEPDAGTLRQLSAHEWPGNVRELMHHIERIALMSDSPRIPHRLWLSFPAGAMSSGALPKGDLKAAVNEFKQSFIQDILARCGGNQTEAAKVLGIERTHLNRLLAEYDGRR